MFAPTDLLTISDASRATGISRQHLVRLVSRGDIPARFSDGYKVRRVLLRDVVEWRAQHGTRSLQPAYEPFLLQQPPTIEPPCGCEGSGWIYVKPPQNTYLECACRTRPEDPCTP